MNRSFSLDPFAIFAIVINAWVIVSAITIYYAPLGIWDVFDPFAVAQYVYENFGGTDDDNDTGILITLFLLPSLALTLTLSSYLYNKFRKQPFSSTIAALVVNVIAFLPLIFLVALSMIDLLLW